MKQVLDTLRYIVYTKVLEIDIKSVDRLTYWRINTLFAMIFAGVLLGLPVFLILIPVAVTEQLWGLLLFDSFAAAGGIILLAWPGIKLKYRSGTCLGLIYLVGVIVIINVGPLSGGPLWLFAFAVMAGVLLGFKAALWAIGINAVTITGLIFLRTYELWGKGFSWFDSPSLMIVAAVNFLFLNAMVAVSVSVLLRGMFQSHEKEKRLVESLHTEKNRLLQTQKSLEQEISKHETTEKALRESERKYRYLFNHAPVGIYEIDFKKFRFVEVNDVLCTLSGYSQEELLKLDPSSFMTRNSLQAFEKRYRQLKRGQQGDVREMEYEMRTRDGQIKNIVLNNDYIYEDDVLTGARVVVHDITEAKKTQEVMIQTEKMMSVGGLAAGMAHEINNPLSGMIQSAQVVASRMKKDLPANIKAAQKAGISMDNLRQYMEARNISGQLDNISLAGHRAARIIRNMLSFSRKSSSEKEVVSLPKLLDTTIELAQNDYDLKKHQDFKSIRIKKEYGSGLPDILCEKSKIQQVLFNLLKNASEAMRDQAHKKEPEITIRLRKKEESVFLEVADNGPGMDGDVRKRIFEPFFTTKGVDKGTGLGLSVSYFIIKDDHDGDMHVESESGKGARFVIRLPIKGKKYEQDL